MLIHHKLNKVTIVKNITDHLVDTSKESLRVTSFETGHRYTVSGFSTYNNRQRLLEPVINSREDLDILFQDGPVPENGENGVTLEALLAICKDRLEYFQSGKFPCKENAVALEHIEGALKSLKARTRNRLDRGVEGKEIV
jgi:hypothetical protein